MGKGSFEIQMKTRRVPIAECQMLSAGTSRNTYHASRITHHESPITNHQLPISAFTLLEVMIACGIFFIAMFAILGLVSNCLRNARALRHIEVDAGLGRGQLSKTNRLPNAGFSVVFGVT